MAEFRAGLLFVLNLKIGGMPAIGVTPCGKRRSEHPVYDVLEVV